MRSLRQQFTGAVYCISIVQIFTIKSTYNPIIIYLLGSSAMRIFVSSVDQTGTRRNTRLLLHNCTSTTQLTRQICKELNIPRGIALIKLKSDFINLVVIDNWPLEHYPVKSGTTFTLEIVQSATKQNLQLAEPLYKIEEQIFNEQQVDSQGSPSNSSKSAKQKQPQHNKIQLKYSHYLEQCLTRMLETVRNGNLQNISAIMKEQPLIADEVQLEQIIKKKSQYLLNQMGDCGRNALHWAIHTNNIDVVSFLLIKGASLNKVTIDQYSPLQLAVQHHSSAIVSLLLQQPNFNVNQVTKHGTALHLAVRNQDLKCIELLLQNDASLDIPDGQNNMPIDICNNQKIKAILSRKAEMGKMPKPTITKGVVYRVTSTTFRLKQRNLLLNPFKNEVIFSTVDGEVQQKLALNVIEEAEEITQKSWLMKSSLFYFKLIMKNEEKDIIIATKQSVTHKRWLKNFRTAVKYQQFIVYIKPIAAADQVIEILDDQKGQVVLHKRKVEEKGSKKTQSIMNLKVQEDYSAMSPQSKAKQLKKTAEESDSKSNEDERFKESQIMLGSVIQVKRLNSKSTPSSNSQIQNANSPSKSQTQSGSRFRKNSDNRVQIVSQFEPNIITPQISYVDFQMLKLLGNGAFGKVYLARHKTTGKSYALKVLNKKKLFSKKQLKYAVGEANILKKLDSQFIVKLYFAFQTPTNLYMALDHCSLGDLSELIITKQKLKQSTARFIIAQLVLAIQYLHNLKILYRDLKPQNILIAGDGYIRLTDFGLSRQNSFAASFCGSPAYLSPEMLQKKGVGLSTDIYGIGCALYEMVVGEPPFYDDNMDNLFENIRSGKLRFPSHLSIQIKSLISRLLQRDLSKRLGVKNINQIKAHDFFKKFDWNLLKTKKMAPPNEIFINYEQQGQSAEIDLEVSGQKITVVDHDYNETTKMINRVKNFTFVRECNEHKNITSLKCLKTNN